MSLNSRTPNQILILVKVTFPFGQPVYAYQAFANGSDAKAVILIPGDQIGWFVKVQAAFGWSQPAYTLTFETSSMLGTASVSVPNGGSSGFFTVLPLSGHTKYTLAINGIVPTDDPDIQVDPNGTFIITGQGLIIPQHNVRWTVATNAMETYDSLNAVWTPFPAAGLTIAVGDRVQFFAVLTASPPPDFGIVFPPGQNIDVWDSPFLVDVSSFPAVAFGVNENTDNLTVADRNDKSGTQFIFVATLTDASKQSAPYIFKMA